MTKEFRLEKYLGVLGYKENYTITLNEHAFKNNLTEVKLGELAIASAWGPANGRHNQVQVEDIVGQFPHDIEACFGLYALGDIYHNFMFPTITKSRLIDKTSSGNNILTYICKHRHWVSVKHQINDRIHVPWSDKKSKAIWRGAQTDSFTTANSRIVLVKRFIDHDKIDVGFTNIPLWMESNNFSKKYIKPRMSINEMFTYKYIISLEGNDIATNLSWVLYSNSLVIMPVPTRESWLLESCLIPWVHFVPISATMNDLEEKIAWCIANDDKCQKIVENASEYISHFLNFDEEAKLSTQVMEAYFNRTTFICNKDLRQQYGDRLESKKNVKFI